MPVDKIACPVCGTPMNHHADKLLHGDDAGEEVVEFFRCPACGAGASRPAAQLGD